MPRPIYDRRMAERLAGCGMQIAALTPDPFRRMDRRRDRMIDAALREQPGRFDDAALATTLANAEAGPPRASGRRRGQATAGVRRQGHSGGGGGRATRHARRAWAPRGGLRLQVGRGLSSSRIAGGAVPAGLEDEASGDAAPGRLRRRRRTIVAALDLGALERWSGKAGWRGAGAGRDGGVGSSRPPTPSRSPSPISTSRCASCAARSFDGIVSKAAKARAEAYHAAAMLDGAHVISAATCRKPRRKRWSCRRRSRSTRPSSTCA